MFPVSFLVRILRADRMYKQVTPEGNYHHRMVLFSSILWNKC